MSSVACITVNFQDESELNQNSVNSQVHYLPFKIEHDGEVENVSARFGGQVFRDKDSNVAQNYFRGRSIQGDSVQLKDYEGLSVMEEKAPKNAMEIDNSEPGREKIITITKKFDKFTYWNWDMKPTAMDAPVKIKDWLELAQILHEPSGLDLESEESVPVPTISID